MSEKDREREREFNELKQKIAEAISGHNPELASYATLSVAAVLHIMHGMGQDEYLANSKFVFKRVDKAAVETFTALNASPDASPEEMN